MDREQPHIDGRQAVESELKRLKLAVSGLIASSRRLYFVTLGLGAAVIAIATIGYFSNQARIEEGVDAATAICAVQGDYIEDIAQANEILIQMEKRGVKELRFGGISYTTAEIERNIDTMEERLKALRAVSCTRKELKVTLNKPAAMTGIANK